MQNGYDRLAMPLMSSDGSVPCWLVIEAESAEMSLDPEACDVIGGSLPQGWRANSATSGDEKSEPRIQVIERAGSPCIRLVEGQSYEWSVEGKDVPANMAVFSSLKGKRFWKTRRGTAGSFKVVNHLGMADFSLEATGLESLRLTFEFISRKFDFDIEYRRLTEDIASFCQQLLLSWSAPTSLTFNSDPMNERKLLLEQFLFLRNFMTEDRLNQLLEAISRNPHCMLIRETDWVPASTARSSDFVRDPSRMLRDWRRHDGRNVPSEVLDVRKSETHDTAPNRFIKFALGQFRQICADVYDADWGETKEASTVAIEAKEMLDRLDALLARRFFIEVGRMRRLPLDNQTLQKREGYREVLQAWLLTRAAATLNWEGEQDCYKGSTRDVATLYEYWIFIQLHAILESIPGVAPLKQNTTDPHAFISETNGQLTINLKQGKRSRSRYVWRSAHATLNIDLQYERSFSYSDQATGSGSYSRTFRPDYTLSIYPAEFRNEKEAEAKGRVAHLHFDAKYRAEDIAAVFGQLDADEEAITNEKLEGKAESNYKRGDLLKMHTYNDALRHTIGSYVLYPGTKTDGAEKRPKFHEIAPGVGAMVMKPGNAACLDAVRFFLDEVFEHQSDIFSQYRYLSDAGYETLREKPEHVEEEGSNYRIARQDSPCVVLWLKQNQEALFRKHGFAYCWATNEEHKATLDFNLSIEVGAEFIPCGGGQGGAKIGHGWRAKVKSARFMSLEKLRDYISNKGLTKELEPKSAKHYLLFEFVEDAEFKKIDLSGIYRARRSGSDYMAVSCRWREILEQL